MPPERDPLDPTWFRAVLGQFPTGVAIVTGLDSDGSPAGLSVGSFTSVSLDPPLVAFLPDKASTSWPRIAPTGRFCVNVLARGQQDLALRFAASGGDKFDGLGWRPASTGSPIIDGVVAWIDCETDAVHDAGDHEIVVGRVLELDSEAENDPLVFFRGAYGSFGIASG